MSSVWGPQAPGLEKGSDSKDSWFFWKKRRDVKTASQLIRELKKKRMVCLHEGRTRGNGLCKSERKKPLIKVQADTWSG